MMDAAADRLDHGLLPVAGSARIYWEMSGHPDGIPVLFLHGGPGSGLGRGGYRRHFDGTRYCVVGIDQRGCGRSRPLATADLAGLAANTTSALIADIEAVRAHLGIERWLVSGVSWGTTLALAYAQQHPKRVTALVLAAVTTTSRGRRWPGSPRASDASSPKRGRPSRRRPAGAGTSASSRPMRGASRATTRRTGGARPRLDRLGGGPHLPRRTVARITDDPDRDAVFATLVTHYWANDGFLRGPDAILARMDRLRDIPGILIHGRRDISGPAVTAWRLHRLWPESRLHIVEGEGHGGPEMSARMREATDALAR